MTLATILILVHVGISLVGIASGLVVMLGLLAAKRLDNVTLLFLSTTVLTSLTGFILPAPHLMPSHVVAIVSLVVLTLAIFARYGRHMAGGWRKTYVISAVTALYLNVFVLVVQLFMKVPALKALAPTQSEPPFAVTQLVVLAVFIVLGVFATIRFRHEPVSAA